MHGGRFDILSHKGHASQNHTGIPSHLVRMTIMEKTTTNAGEDGGKERLSNYG
jgi:hypothetical protein